MSFFENITNLQNILDWFKNYYNTPEGKRAMILIATSLAFGFYHGSNRYDAGMAVQKSQDSTAIADIKKEFSELKKISLAQQKRLEDQDCTEVVMKYKSLFENLESKTSQSMQLEIAKKNKEIEERKITDQIVVAEEKKTKELLKIKNNLK